MARPAVMVKDTVTGEKYPSIMAAARTMGPALLNIDPNDAFKWFKLTKKYPDRFHLSTDGGDTWMTLAEYEVRGMSLDH